MRGETVDSGGMPRHRSTIRPPSQIPEPPGQNLGGRKVFSPSTGGGKEGKRRERGRKGFGQGTRELVTRSLEDGEEAI